MLDVARLRVFREVAARGSFTAAANALHYSQPAVSHHVARLEEDVLRDLVPSLGVSGRRLRAAEAVEG